MKAGFLLLINNQVEQTDVSHFELILRSTRQHIDNCLGSIATSASSIDTGDDMSGFRTIRFSALLSAALVVISAAFLEGQSQFGDLVGSKWSNKRYPSGREDLRIVVVSDTEMELYDSLSAEKPKLRKRVAVTKSWTDENGDFWFQDTAERKWASSLEYSGPEYYELNKISASGTVWEITASQESYPTVMGFAGGSYSIRYKE